MPAPGRAIRVRIERHVRRRTRRAYAVVGIAGELDVRAHRLGRRDARRNAGVEVVVVLIRRLVVVAIADRDVELLGDADRDFAEHGVAVDVVAIQAITRRRPRAARERRDPAARYEIARNGQPSRC